MDIQLTNVLVKREQLMLVEDHQQLEILIQIRNSKVHINLVMLRMQVLMILYLLQDMIKLFLQETLSIMLDQDSVG